LDDNDDDLRKGEAVEDYQGQGAELGTLLDDTSFLPRTPYQYHHYPDHPLLNSKEEPSEDEQVAVLMRYLLNSH
jgi:hypothetical protein